MVLPWTNEKIRRTHATIKLSYHAKRVVSRAEGQANGMGSRRERNYLVAAFYRTFGSMKKWKKNLMQFALLFMAVFLGFMADNFRENLADRNKEQEIIRGLIRNLKADTSNMSSFIDGNRRKDAAWDSLLHMASLNLSLPENTNRFYRNFSGGGFVPIFTPSDASIVQLKEGGNLNLIKKTVIDSILNYDYWNRIIVTHNHHFFVQHEFVWGALYPIVRGDLLMDTTYLNFYKGRVLRSMPPLDAKPQEAQIFFGAIARTLLFTRANRNYLIRQRARAERLILLLEKEYKGEL